MAKAATAKPTGGVGSRGIDPNAPTRTVATSSSPPGGGTTSGGGSYQDGSQATVVATHNANYVFKNWTYINGLEASKSATYTFQVSGNATLIANFELHEDHSMGSHLQVLNGPIIEAGQSLSAGLDCSMGSIIRLTMPAGWTGAALTFQISTDGNGYNDLFDRDGNEISMPNIVPGTAVVVAHIGDDLKAIRFLKLRSGSRSNPVAQQARREFAVTVEVPTTLGAARR